MKKRPPKPPRIAKWLLSRLTFYEEHFALSDAIDDEYLELRATSGRFKSGIYYRFHTLEILFQYTRLSMIWSIIMFTNYVKIAFRNIMRQKAYSFINIAGLAIGLACCIIIFMYISHELSFDRYHKDADRIYRIPTIVRSGSVDKFFARGLTPLIAEIRKDYPEAETAVRFQYLATSNVKVEHDERVLVENSLMLAEPELFEIFTIPFVIGDPASALDRPGTIVITQEIADKLFQQTGALGKTIKINDEPYEISGIVENAPDNTHLAYDIILSLKTLETRMNLDNWGWTGFYSYVKLSPNANPEDFEKKISNIAHSYIGEELDKLGIEFVVFLQKLTDIHLHSDLHREIKVPGDPTYIYVFSVAGILVLLIACINFMNLTTARSIKRAKEVGVRKVMGAHRLQVVNQFMGEFLVLTLIALAMAILLINQVLPYFNELTGKHLTTAYMFQPVIIKALIGLILIVGLAAGSYPALFLSSFKPARIFQNFSMTGLGGARVRKVLVVWQFAISIALIIGTLLIYKQIDFMKNKPLGFAKEQKLILPVYLEKNVESIKKEFIQHPSITGATASSSIPGRISNSLVTKRVDDGNDRGWTILYNFVDDDFISDYDIELIAGRPFRKDMITDASGAIILNEAAVETFGFPSAEHALGKQLTRGSSTNEIIGVVKDFHIGGLQNEIPPHIMQLRASGFGMLSLTVSLEDLGGTLAFVENKWQELHLGNSFSYFFLDEDFNRQYGSEERMGKLFSIFTVLGIIVAVLGLFGLASFIAEQRTKEIGIRKVLGASVSGLILLITKEFTIWVLLANLFAWPFAYFFVNHWLQNFAYRTSIEPWVFLVSGTIALVIGLLTIAFQAIQAAFANPVDSLRYE